MNAFNEVASHFQIIIMTHNVLKIIICLLHFEELIVMIINKDLCKLPNISLNI